MERSLPVLVAAGVTYYSCGDEHAFFEWLKQLPCLREVRGVGRELRMVLASPPTDDELRELVALFSRYQIEMRQLAQFETAQNSNWFRQTETFWYRSVFG